MTDTELQAGDELNACVAEKVMGWHVHHRNTVHWTDSDKFEYRVRGIVGEWSPSTDPAADYEVLKVVREWRGGKRRAFGDALWAIWQTRWVNAACPSTAAILYQPGDYSRAAMKAVAKTDGG